MKKNLLIIVLSTIILTSSCSQKKRKKIEEKTDHSFKMVIRDDPTTTIEKANIWEQLDKNPKFNSLTKLINQAGLIETIKNLDGVTLFAPTNKAINSLNEATYNALRAPENLGVLKSFLSYHIVKETYSSYELTQKLKESNNPLRLQTIQNGYIAIRSTEGQALEIVDEMGNTSRISEPDIKAGNGVIHGIEDMLVPQIKQKLKE